MNEDVVTAVADQLALLRLEPEPSAATRAVARTLIRSLNAAGFVITSRTKRELQRSVQ